jgi:transmembrane sensor
MDALFSRLKYLLHSYTTDKQTPAERQELMELIRMGVHEGEIKELMAAEIALLEQLQADYLLPDEKSARILWNIFNAAVVTRPEGHVELEGHAGPDEYADYVPHLPGQGRMGKRTKQRWVWRAAAVLLFITAGLGSYRVLSGHRREQVVAALIEPSLDAVPGGNKAMLFLANGSKIILDSARSGKLTQQGGTNVIKIDSDRLAYSGSNENSTEILYNTLATPRGGQYQLTLPDGSRVWLNAASSIRYPTTFRGAERNVTITGEAYFEVTKNTKMPFVVNAGPTRTTVLGTHFNVKAYPDERSVSTTLLEGGIKISLAGDERIGDERILRPGQQAVLDEATRLLTVRDADTFQAIAWKNGLFDFDQTDIPAIMRQISRWYDVDVSYRWNYDGVKFGGGISRQLNLSHVLRLLDKNGVHTKLEDKKLIVLP